MSKFHIYGLGAALVDTEIEVSDQDLTRHAIAKGVMTLVDEKRQHQLIDALSDHLQTCKRASGGSCANSIIAASYFGASTFYSCKVANDENGQFYLSDLEAANVKTPENSGNESGITGKCLVMITPDAERTMNTFLGISETVSTEQLDLSALSTSEYVYIEGYLVSSATGKAAAIALKQAADEANVKTAFSLSDPAMVSFFGEGLKEMIGTGVDILFCNEDEALGFTNEDKLDKAEQALRQIANTVVITLGARGARIIDKDGAIDIAPCPTKAVDTNGAGDMFAGAFLYAISHQYSLEQAGNFAANAAAQVVSQYGPRLRPEQHEALKNLLK